MRDEREPTHVYLEIMRMRKMFDYGILAAADRVEKDRRAQAERGAPGLRAYLAAPMLIPEEARQNGRLTEG